MHYKIVEKSDGKFHIYRRSWFRLRGWVLVSVTLLRDWAIDAAKTDAARIRGRHVKSEEIIDV